MRTGHLFAGAGGGLYADLILGHRPVFAVEWDAYAARALQQRADDGWFPGLHVHHGDVQLFDTSEWEGRVDSIHAGFPCQDISVAGNGAGIEGERSGLWGEVKRIAGELRPQELFLENSPAITSRGLDVVLGDLAELGYDAQWCVLPASAVGARTFELGGGVLHGVPTPTRASGDKEIVSSQGGKTLWHSPRDSGDTDSSRQLQQEGDQQEQRGRIGNAGEEIPHTDCKHDDGRGYGASEVCRQRPEKAELPGSKSTLPDAQSERQEWTPNSSGAPRGRRTESADWWAVEPNVGRVVDGLANRGNRIKCLGNGQVPLQAAAAYVLLDAGLGT